jgi:hypothetical protein
MRASDYRRLGEIFYTGAIGLIGSLDAYVASQTHSPLMIGTSAILLYCTAESTNKLLGNEKPLCLKAISGIAKYLKK